jgi:hypothetical protein
MDQLDPSQNVDETYLHIPRSRSGSGVSTTGALIESIRLSAPSPGTVSFDTGSFAGSKPPSSKGPGSPVYNSPGLSHRSAFSHSELPPQQAQLSSFPLSNEASLSDNCFGNDRLPQTPLAPLLRVEPAEEELGRPASPPPRASIETGAMRFVRPLTRPLHIG